MLDKDIICKSLSLYVFLVVIVRKKDGFIRLCIDYCWFNLKIVRDVFLLFRIDEFFDVLYGVKLFSICDLVSGFY